MKFAGGLQKARLVEAGHADHHPAQPFWVEVLEQVLDDGNAV